MDFLKARAQVVKTDAEFNGRIKVLGSTETEHRSGRIIRQDGWRLDNFRKNPVALFEHFEPIGTAGVEKTSRGLEFDIKLAEEGTSRTVDYVRSLVRQGILTTASVGWMPVDGKVKMLKNGGVEFLESELIEISLVVIPDNPDAVKLAASFGLEVKTASAPSEFESRFWAAQTRNANRLREIELMKMKCPRMDATS